MESKAQFIDLGQLSSRKELLTTNDKYKCVQFNFGTGEGLSKHRHNGYATVIVLNLKWRIFHEPTMVYLN